MDSTIHVRIDTGMLEQVDRFIDPTIGQTRSLFVREAVKERLNRMNSMEATV